MGTGGPLIGRIWVWRAPLFVRPKTPGGHKTRLFFCLPPPNGWRDLVRVVRRLLEVGRRGKIPSHTRMDVSGEGGKGGGRQQRRLLLWRRRNSYYSSLPLPLLSSQVCVLTYYVYVSATQTKKDESLKGGRATKFVHRSVAKFSPLCPDLNL